MSFDDQNPYAASNFDEGPYHGGGNAVNVPDYLVWSILSTLCCCPPFGIISIVFSALTMGAKQSGNYAVAMQHAKNAKIFLWIAVGLGLAFWAFYAIINIIQLIMFIVVASGGLE